MDQPISYMQPAFPRARRQVAARCVDRSVGLGAVNMLEERNCAVRKKPPSPLRPSSPLLLTLPVGVGNNRGPLFVQGVEGVEG